LESTISCDKKEKKESKKSIDECKEIDREESKRILELEKTTTAQLAMIKKGQHNKVILMGIGMQLNKILAGAALKKKAQSLTTELQLITAGAALKKKA
jgi:hypothetical protein